MGRKDSYCIVLDLQIYVSIVIYLLQMSLVICPPSLTLCHGAKGGMETVSNIGIDKDLERKCLKIVWKKGVNL